METNVNIEFNIDDIDKTLSKSEYTSRLVSLLQPVLDKEFTNSSKRRIRVFSDRINFACPICGDSVKSNTKKRGNFIIEGKHKGFYKCFNCSEFKRIDTFFDDFNVVLELDVINYLSSNLGNFKDGGHIMYDMSGFLEMEHIEKYSIEREELKNKFGLVEVRDSAIISYLRNRLQFQEEKFLYSPLKKYVLVLNLTPSGKILGVQQKVFSGDNPYLTYKLSKLYAEMKKPFLLTPEQVDYLDTLSMLFNICLVNFKRPVSMFEGPMDSFLFKNSIANTGANKQLNVEIPIRYFYDYDPTGRKKTMEKLNQGEEVFLWDRLIRDTQLPFRKKWDLNDLFIYLRKNKMPMPDFEKYFSKDPLDAIDI